MKVYLINPRFPLTLLGWEHSAQMVGKRYASPPAGLLTIAGLTPPEFEVEFCDENTHPIQWGSDAEVVALRAQHLQSGRLIEIARRFRAMGKRIVVGGPSVTVVPDWYRPMADVLIRGEAEHLWPRFLRDLAAGVPQAEYHETGQVNLADSPMPRYEFIKPRDYLYVGVQTTRGCPFTCEFCDIITLFGRNVRTKPVGRVLEELERVLALGWRHIFFVDDNFIGNRRYAAELLEAIAALVRGLRHPPVFSCQASVNVAKDLRLLRLMREAGMRTVSMGVETPREASLLETRKYQNTRTDLLQDIERVQSHGLLVTAGSVVGFDHDDLEIFNEHVEFFTRANVAFVFPSQLVALPSTPLYARLHEEGRLLRDVWWLGFATANFVPRQMTNEQLTAGYTSLLTRLYAPDAYAARVLGELERVARAPTSPRARFVAGPLLWAAFGWVLLWFLFDPHRRDLLRLFWRVVPRAVSRYRRVADIALMRVVNYRHLHRLSHAWACAYRGGLLRTPGQSTDRTVSETWAPVSGATERPLHVGV